MKTKVKVVIPVYKSALKKNEQKSLDNTMKKLSRYPIVFLVNNQVEIAPYLDKYPQATVLTVSDDWLGTRRGIQGYNEMMMSKEFYELFSDTEYILICHLDAWIFRDELEQWCDAGYDLVAAPWPNRPIYRYFPIKQFISIRNRVASPEKTERARMRGRIGNGGLCLRCVQTFRDICVEYADVIQEYISRGPRKKLCNEDVFFAFEVKNLKVPSAEEAFNFSYDCKPHICYKLNHKRVPMGCHGYSHKSRVKFWSRFIPDMDIPNS